MFVLFFYFLSPVPTVISRRLSGSLDSSSSALIELCIFLTVGIVVSAVGLPIVLARTSVVCIIDKYMKIHFQIRQKKKSNTCTWSTVYCYQRFSESMECHNLFVSFKFKVNEKNNFRAIFHTISISLWLLF